MSYLPSILRDLTKCPCDAANWTLESLIMDIMCQILAADGAVMMGRHQGACQSLKKGVDWGLGRVIRLWTVAALEPDLCRLKKGGFRNVDNMHASLHKSAV